MRHSPWWLLLLVAPALAGADGAPPGASPVTLPVAPVLDGQTVAVLRLRLAADSGALGKRLERLTGRAVFERLAVGRSLTGLQQALRSAGAEDLYAVVSLADVPDSPPFLAVPLGGAAREREVVDALRATSGLGGAEVLGKLAVAGVPRVRDRLRALAPVGRPDLTAGLSAAGGSPLTFALAPTVDARRILEELVPRLPAEAGGGPVEPLSRGLRWVAGGLDLPDGGARLVVQAADEAAARALKELAGRAGEAAAGSKAVRGSVPGLDRLLPALRLEASGARLTRSLPAREVDGALGPLLTAWALAAEREQTLGDVLRVVQALHDYESTHRTFPPPAVLGPGGKPLLSWRVLLLPHLGEKKLFGEFRLDEPWDGPNNRKLLARMPPAFRPASARLAREYRTTLQVPVGEGTLFPPRKEGVAVRDVADGLSQTLLLVDVEEDRAVEWTRPADWAFEPARPATGLATRFPEGTVVGVGDGQVSLLPRGTPGATLRALFTRAGGEPVKAPW